MGKWTLADIIDFETCVHHYSDDLKGDKLIESNIIRPVLEKQPKLSTKKKKSIGLKAWLKHRLKDFDTRPSTHWLSAFSSVNFLLAITFFNLGFGSILGLMNWQDKSYNLAILLGVTILLTWALFLFSTTIYLLSKGKSHPWFSLLTTLINHFWKKIKPADFPHYGTLHSLQKPLKKQLFKSLQMHSLIYSIGCLLGIIFVIFFLEVQIYWEATLTGNMTEFWLSITNFLSLPWQWSGFAVPTHSDIEHIRLSDFSLSSKKPKIAEKWAYFCMLSILTWSCIPRLLFYLIGSISLKTTLATTQFEEARHRQLWRRLSTEIMETSHDKKDDSVTLIDLGGSGVQLETIRPFILQKLRLNPEQIFTLGTLDASKNQLTEEHLRETKSPVVFCCEATEFSPKSIKAQIDKVQLFNKETQITLVLLGTNSPSEPSQVLIDQWTTWVDQLADPNIHLVSYKKLQPIEKNTNDSTTAS